MSSERTTHRSTTAVLVGVEDIRGLYAARTLAAHGVSSTAVTRDRRSFPCKSRFISDIVEAETRTGAFVATLAEIGPSFADRPILIPCTDMVVRHLSEHRELIDPWYVHTLPDQHVVETLTDKIEMHRHAMRCGLPVPRGCEILAEHDLDRVMATLTFPLALKPRNSKTPAWLSATNAKAFRVVDAAELRDLVAQFLTPSGGLLAQEWIDGPDSELYACHGYFDQRAEPLAMFLSRKLRQWPPSTGQGCLAEEVDDPRVREIALDLFRSINFSGLGYVELKRNPRTDEFLIVEPNIGRVSGRMAIAEQGGVDLLYTAYCRGHGLPLPARRTQQQTGAKWIYLRQDVQSAAVHLWRRELSIRDWRRSIRGPKSYAVYSPTDLRPFLGELLDGARTFWRRQIRSRMTTPRGGSVEARTPRAVSRASARHFYESVFERSHAETGFAYPEEPDGHYVVPILQTFLDDHSLTDRKCLEVGTGYGQCQDLVPDYTGIDIAVSSGQHLHRPFVNANATELPFPDASFGCVWSNHVMEHVDRPDRMLEEMWRVLEPGGYLFVTATWQVGPWLADGHPVRPFSDFDMRGKVTKATWRLRDTVAFRALHVFPRRASTLLRRLVRPDPIALKYTSLRPTYEHNWQPDATAESSVEPYSVYSWFVDRGAECLNRPTELSAFFIRTGHLTFRKPHHSSS